MSPTGWTLAFTESEPPDPVRRNIVIFPAYRSASLKDISEDICSDSLHLAKSLDPTSTPFASKYIHPLTNSVQYRKIHLDELVQHSKNLESVLLPIQKAIDAIVSEADTLHPLYSRQSEEQPSQSSSGAPQSGLGHDEIPIQEYIDYEKRAETKMKPYWKAVKKRISEACQMNQVKGLVSRGLLRQGEPEILQRLIKSAKSSK